VRFLSQDWLDLQKGLAERLPERPGATARVQYVVTGAPDGEVRYFQSWLDGRLGDSGLGDDQDAELTYRLAYVDARQIAEGALDANVAFMQGRVKVTGDMGKVMALMPLTSSDDHHAAVLEISAQTDY